MLTRLYIHLLKETQKEECRRKRPNAARAEVTFPPLPVSRHLVKTPNQTWIFWRFWGKGCGGAVKAALGEWAGSVSDQRVKSWW